MKKPVFKKDPKEMIELINIMYRDYGYCLRTSNGGLKSLRKHYSINEDEIKVISRELMEKELEKVPKN